MREIVCLLALTASTAAQWTSLSPAREIAEHWTVEGAPADIWSLRDGVIHCLGKPNGFLRSRKSYRNYVFRAEWRFIAAGWQGAPAEWPNAGFFIHAKETADQWPRSLEVQGHFGEAGSVFGVRGGSIVGARRGPIVEKRPRFGDWDRYEIIARNGWVRVILNGDVVNEGFAASPDEGHICLQSEGWPVEYRNLQILELNAGGFPEPATIEQDLLEVARVAVRAVDGAHPDEALLQRLTRLTGYEYGVNFWKPVEGKKTVRQAMGGASALGKGDVAMTFEIRKVFDPGQRMTVKGDGWLAVLAPVLASAGDGIKVVGMVEIVCRYGGR
ncbi:MAG: DUF1080 domain-containing protein [Bryobacteraceae bacterium]